MSSRPAHLLRVEEGPRSFASLIAAARERGVRVGWLELEVDFELPEALAEVAGVEVLRAVAVGAAGSVAVKPRSGPPVMKDLCREFFAGCALVLVRGDLEAPLLVPEGELWRLEPKDGGARRWSTEELISALRRPTLLPQAGKEEVPR